MAGRRKPRKTVKAPPMTAAIYARFSSSKQREASIEDQLRVCRAWCSDNGYEVVAEYCDRAASGRTDERAEFQRMVSNAGEAEVCVVYMMDRFSRDVYDAPIYKKRLRDAGCRVVSATESMPDGPESMLMESIYEAMAAMESAHTSQRTKRGMEGNALKCMHNGVVVYGYDLGDDGLYHVNEAQAERVREAFAMRASGMSYMEIAKRLARCGVRTYAGSPCSYGMVRAMIANEKYVGTYRWGDVVVEGGMPAILSREEFDVANAVRSAKRRRDEDWTDYALSSKGVCGCCGMNLVGVSGHSRNGAKYTYYRCSARCGNRTVRADWLEDLVARSVRGLLSREEARAQLVSAMREAMGSDSSEAERESLEAELADIDRKVTNLAQAVEDGMPYAMAEPRVSALSGRRREVEARLDAIEDLAEFDPEGFVEFLRSADDAADRVLLDAVVWQVQLFGDRVVAVLSYDAENPKTKEFEPARVEISTGSNESFWLPAEPAVRTLTSADVTTTPTRKSTVVRDGRVSAYVADGLVVIEIAA